MSNLSSRHSLNGDNHMEEGIELAAWEHSSDGTGSHKVVIPTMSLDGSDSSVSLVSALMPECSVSKRGGTEQVKARDLDQTPGPSNPQLTRWIQNWLQQAASVQHTNATSDSVTTLQVLGLCPLDPENSGTSPGEIGEIQGEIGEIPGETGEM
ncbi:hypothetical protein M231_07944 [Tremella mesenterica]|uniref:Uncharacterized protein n=1 Tax=Tremella mesenterica TaxID=5217 RepID=A0A4Q1B7X5_TREME|nr:hypothetical protein M231_07944 [Tremella mesenterica]